MVNNTLHYNYLIENGTNPTRIICDSTLKIPLDCNIVKTANEIPTIIATGNNYDKEKKKLIPKPVLSKATIKTLTNDTVIAVLKLYSYKVNIITILARPNFNPGIISPIKVK